MNSELTGTGLCDCGADRCTGYKRDGQHVKKRDMPQLAPYRSNGSLCHHESDVPWGRVVEWRPIEPFHAALTYAGSRRGRSAAYFYWTDDATGARYPMFMSGMDGALEAGAIQGNRITGRFTVVKMGQNYGLSYLGPAE